MNEWETNWVWFWFRPYKLIIFFGGYFMGYVINQNWFTALSLGLFCYMIITVLFGLIDNPSKNKVLGRI